MDHYDFTDYINKDEFRVLAKAIEDEIFIWNSFYDELDEQRYIEELKEKWEMEHELELGY